MNWRPKFKFTAAWRNALASAALCVLVGLATLGVADGIVLLSYDFLFPFRGRQAIEDVLIVYMDDRSLKELNQASIPEWDLNEHAKLLEQFAADRARLVVFDILLNAPAPEPARRRFAEAIRRQKNVVLAAVMDQQQRPQIEKKGLVLPWPEFIDAGAKLGIAGTASLPGAVVRQYHPGTEFEPSLARAAALAIGAAPTNLPGATQPHTWLTYYGPALSLPSWSYAEVKHQPPGFFRDKVIFVGARPSTLKPYEEADLFRTPHQLWGGEFGALFPGVEIGATEFLNIIRRDGLLEMRLWPNQILILLIIGLLVGSALPLLRPWPATGAALGGIALCLLVALAAARQHVWFAWSVIAFVQIPCGLAWGIGRRAYQLKLDKEVLVRTLEEATRLAEATKSAAPKRTAQMIPDHELVKRVGKGAYGEVWLARNAIGAYHAVKIVQRRGFPADEPYEREFKGIQKFMPISRSHPGFVNILHVGRNDDERYFFCIMEAGDDKTAGQLIDPETYSPKTLGSELEWRGKLAPEEVIRLGLALTLALEHLHQSHLIHRDIKPANIIYVNAAPKFADIGLVTDVRSAGRDVSFLGTEGYIAPEGPGTPSADVYALGMVLYEAAMGRDRRLFPEVPTAVLEQSCESLLRRLNEVIFKACEMAANERYATAAAMHADLLRLLPSGK